MTERSLFWTDGTGDGGPYSQSELRLLVKALAGVEDNTTDGVFLGQLNQLAATIEASSRVDVQSGRAQVDGTIFEVDATTQLTPSTPVVDTTGGSVVLAKDWTAQTVRLALIASADGTSTPPAVTQTDGVTWQIRLYDFEVTTGGTVQNLVDHREFMGGSRMPMAPVMSNEEIKIRVHHSVGIGTTGTWGVANEASFTPFAVTEPVTVKRLLWRVGTAGGNGNYDVGIYDSDSDGRPRTKLVSTGSTAFPAANSYVTENTVDTSLSPGLYFFAFVASSTTDTVIRLSDFAANAGSAYGANLDGWFRETSALPLPATATPVEHSGSTQLVAPIITAVRSA